MIDTISCPFVIKKGWDCIHNFCGDQTSLFLTKKFSCEKKFSFEKKIVLKKNLVLKKFSFDQKVYF